MPASASEPLRSAIQGRWSGKPSVKAGRYIESFFNRTHTAKKIAAQVEGNHGIYTVSIQLEGRGLSAACSCYIGKEGFCHHCEALAFAFLRGNSDFNAIEAKKSSDIHDIEDVEACLKGVTLDALLKQLAGKGITQKAFAESIGMNPRHLSAIKSSELRNRYFNELGAMKLACLWVLEHIGGDSTG